MLGLGLWGYLVVKGVGICRGLLRDEVEGGQREGGWEVDLYIYIMSEV